ncbi:DUF350 domain-containing protein [Quadrisphaera setariae]|uniref:DUF350 domain-containing protein n=1 Tax=Quadrisphaera setariae TaxID=2593304 RepID=UPI001C9D598C|nr:DUF350 domain-containing protein [Quadrisphaera setariae]
MDGLVMAVGAAAVYTAVGLGLLLAGFYALDLIVPGKLATRVFRDAEPGAALVTAAGALGVGLITFTTIWRNADAGFGPALLWTVVFGLVGIVMQAVALVVLDLLTPGRLGDLVCTHLPSGAMHPAAWVTSAFQLAMAGVVVASVA